MLFIDVIRARLRALEVTGKARMCPTTLSRVCFGFEPKGLVQLTAVYVDLVAH
jgi:hypothetical protein